ncbi:hypothetical protein JCGZ_17238 [Jatropha curcas]|uniref:Glabrous enhancer-binding protein-like DBD domain-containing protein n=1 Tax=Jatropha curcas TaxID=180498 RepID=A0A067LAY0_JATCU|nr:GLABROUS1 enhancer-binding protein-like [Jatropha curcas]KDP45631.1 hypothetical protein JCGZ_17238 [Jatropha curcas]
MAPKRSKPLENPPPVSSSDEEEETSSGEEEDGEEEEGSSSEEEETLTPIIKPPQAQAPKPAVKKPDSTTQRAESDSESESDSDSEDDGKATVKPIASKPMEETPTKTTKSRSKPSASTSSVTKSIVAVKRVSEADRDPKDSKRPKKKESESDGVVEKSEDTKKQLFQRLWSEDDEIAVLEGLIEYAEKKGVDPAKDMTSFFEYIKKSLHFDVSLSQLKDKVSRLKKKFENHVTKGKKGEDKTFSKPHDQKSFDLSKRIWGSAAGVESSVKSNGKAINNNNSKGKGLAALKAELGLGSDVDKEAEKVDKKESHSGLKQISEFDKGVSVSGMEDFVVKRGLDMLDGAKKAEMEEKWRELHVAELELFLKRNELIREQAKLMLAAYKTE